MIFRLREDVNQPAKKPIVEDVVAVSTPDEDVVKDDITETAVSEAPKKRKSKKKLNE